MTDSTAARARWARHVRRQAAGLTPEQIARKLRGVRAWERNGTAPADTTSYSAVGARCSVAEWERIAALVAASGAETYDPDSDPDTQPNPAEDLVATTNRPALVELRAARIAAREYLHAVNPGDSEAANTRTWRTVRDEHGEMTAIAPTCPETHDPGEHMGDCCPEPVIDMVYAPIARYAAAAMTAERELSERWADAERRCVRTSTLLRELKR
ncbi:hypothetical protein ACIBSV_12230 [Embleya sp. NPDC050154]|uniref:hypothetical protein n=1 Tax=Embleya sp. NPDC050154 TaxID=3363988 RepID=UPI0037B5E395